jgi:hypothetical protein
MRYKRPKPPSELHKDLVKPSPTGSGYKYPCRPTTPTEVSEDDWCLETPASRRGAPPLPGAPKPNLYKSCPASLAGNFDHHGNNTPSTRADPAALTTIVDLKHYRCEDHQADRTSSNTPERVGTPATRHRA